ncbi:hypothetical protein C1N80_06595 [Brachybacterium sp. SGAir0954]|uniref:hypothetical protein n=1 Tax=Brachybacterium sp. SGAir0954 TaxID=2571029 RepID=UPI0010CD0479|nr:hypothetical protein [Brachybacterium sp. SGAir0954]QCR53281.1 hypothetical protein C1N80_06595 [Brachybacterium sp. SGAir0954]
MTAAYPGAPQGGQWRPGPAAPAKRRSKGPVVLLVIGALILVLSLVAGSPVALGPPVSIGGIFSGIDGVLLAVLGGILGFLLLLASIIRMVVQRRRTA